MDKSMRIALVSREYPPETAHGGIGSQAYAKAHGLAARGHEVVVISAGGGRTCRRQMQGDVTVIRVADRGLDMPLHTEVAEWLAHSGAVAAELERQHAQQPFDVVEFPEWSGEGFVHLTNRTPWHDVPTVIHIHGPLVMFANAVGWPDVDSNFYRVGTFLEGTALRLADAVYSSSACSADWCAKWYDVDRGAIDVLHTGVDTERFTPPADPPSSESEVVAFVGRLTGDKGAFTLADAAIRLVETHPRLVVRFYGPAEPDVVAALAARAARAGRPTLFEFGGFVDHDDLPAALGAAKVFALPSTHEPGPGMVYLEAMACGLPVIACSGAGAAEVVESGVTGQLIEPKDVSALVEVLHRLLTDEPARAAMGARARSYAVEQASTPQAIERLETLYRDVVARKVGLAERE